MQTTKTEAKADWPDLTRTAAALEQYDAIREAYMKDEGVGLWVELAACGDAVRKAFVSDTSDRNSPESARLIAPGDPWLRQLIASWREATA